MEFCTISSTQQILPFDKQTMDFCMNIQGISLVMPMLYGLLIVFGSNFGSAVLTSAVSIGVKEDDDSSSLMSAGIVGMLRWLEAVVVADCSDCKSSGSGVVWVFRQNGDWGWLLLPSVNGSMGGMFDAGISIEISIFTGAECEALALVLEVFGVDGVGGGSVVKVEVVLVVGYRCYVAPVDWIVALCIAGYELFGVLESSATDSVGLLGDVLMFVLIWLLLMLGFVP
jgi:hypothetical protein